MNNQNSQGSSNDPQKPASKPETFEEKVKDNLKNARGAKDGEDFLGYAQNNKQQIITYGLLILGLLILMFNNLIGGLLIGAVAGYYFSVEITQFLRNLKSFFEGQDHLRFISFVALLFALIVTAPGVFIGAAIVAALKQQFLT